MAKVCPLFSGSSGNSLYIGASGKGILIDAGRSAKQLETAMQANGLSMESVHSIFITHEHTDHIQGLRVLASRYHIPVYTSLGTLEALCEMGVVNGKYPANVIGYEGMCVDEMFIKPFHTSHDSRESVGYVVTAPDGQKIAVATDLGYFSEEVAKALAGCELIVIESNHDVRMLQNGSYPYYLKRRILSDTGHLSNEACADVLPEFLKNGTRRFILYHLSRENNLPALAYQTSLCSLQQQGMHLGEDFELMVAPRENMNGQMMLL